MERRDIFIDARDYEKFLTYLERTTERFSFVIHGFSLISNHYHIECETPRANLSETMHWLNTCYAGYFNRRYERVGHVFQGRYNAVLIQKERHLLELTRYIHLNPVRAGLVSRPELYEWSSYQRYMGATRKFQWVESDWTLSRFGATRLEARKAYRDFVGEGLEHDLEDPLESAVDGVLGDEGFLGWVAKKFLGTDPLDSERGRRRRVRTILPVQDVIDAVSSLCSLDAEDLRKKGRQCNTARDVALYLSREYSGLKNLELAREFGNMRASNVSNICRRISGEMKTNKNLEKLLSAARQSLVKSEDEV